MFSLVSEPSESMFCSVKGGMSTSIDLESSYTSSRPDTTSLSSRCFAFCSSSDRCFNRFQVSDECRPIVVRLLLNRPPLTKRIWKVRRSRWILPSSHWIRLSRNDATHSRTRSSGREHEMSTSIQFHFPLFTPSWHSEQFDFVARVRRSLLCEHFDDQHIGYSRRETDSWTSIEILPSLRSRSSLVSEKKRMDPVDRLCSIRLLGKPLIIDFTQQSAENCLCLDLDVRLGVVDLCECLQPENTNVPPGSNPMVFNRVRIERWTSPFISRSLSFSSFRSIVEMKVTPIRCRRSKCLTMEFNHRFRSQWRTSTSTKAKFVLLEKSRWTSRGTGLGVLEEEIQHVV